MTIPTKKPGDLTMAEFMALVRETVHRILDEERDTTASNQQGLLDIEPLSMGAWTGEVGFIKRDDSGR